MEGRLHASAHRTGQNFAAMTGDSLRHDLAGIMTRPEILREQTIQGSYATTDLLQAFDLTLQQGTYEPRPLRRSRAFSAPATSSCSRTSPTALQHAKTAGDLGAVQSRAGGHWQAGELRKAVANIAPATTAARRGGARAVPNAPWPPRSPCSRSRTASIYRASRDRPLVIDGSGAGVVAAAAAGLLEDNPTIFYAASLDGDKKLWAKS